MRKGIDDAIQIYEQYYVVSDDYEWAVAERAVSKKTGKPYLKKYTHHGNLKRACLEILDRAGKKATTAQEIIDIMERVETKLYTNFAKIHERNEP